MQEIKPYSDQTKQLAEICREFITKVNLAYDHNFGGELISKENKLILFLKLQESSVKIELTNVFDYKNQEE